MKFRSRAAKIAAAMLFGLLAAGLLLFSLRGKLRLLLAVPASTAFGGLAALLTLRRVELKRWWSVLLANACVALASAYLLHLPLFDWMPVNKTMLFTAALCMFPLCLVTAATANVRVFGAVWLTLFAAFGFIDAAVMDFSSNIITFNDLHAIRTALNVAGNYRLSIDKYQALTITLYGICMVLLLRVKEARPRLRRWPVRLVALVCAVACLATAGSWLWPKKPRTYKHKGAGWYGVLGELLLEARSSSITSPPGYSDAAVARLSEENTLPAKADGDRPSVIVIMNESFSDLRVLGDFRTNVDYMPSFHALEEESIHGWAQVSTLGGGTSRSEWELLTGNTMAFLPEGTTPYDQYMKAGANSVIKVFKAAGYHTVGTHPFKSNGWHRATNYPLLGFDDIYFEDDRDWGERVRKYVSDSAFVRQVIDIYEHRPEGKPLFLFGVSMQNHGGYNYPDFTSDVHIEGLQGQYPSVEQFLSLIRLSDASLKELTDYFRGKDEKVQILFFGDHQPSLADARAMSREIGLDDTNKRYIVPFMIWNNYDQRAEYVERTSLNFLMPRILKEIGLTSAPYFNYLSRLNEQLPAISAIGYSYDGALRDLDDDAAEDLLRDYRIFQYGNLFRTGLDERLFVGETETP